MKLQSDFLFQKLINEEMERKKLVNQLEEKEKAEKNRGKCVFCFENDANMIALPCCHGGYCKWCIWKVIKESGNKCAFCKGIIQDMREIYMPGE